VTEGNIVSDKAASDTTKPQEIALGTIVGKSTTREFTFQIESETKVFEYLKVYHRVYGDVLCQVMEITSTRDDSVALCSIVGFKEQDGAIKGIRIPFDIGSAVLRADDAFIRAIIHLGDEHGALLGKLEGRDIPVTLDLRKILTKHVCVLAKSGAGKSYSVGVLIEEILERNVPLVIIDPHGEYGTLRFPNNNPEDTKKLTWFNLAPKAYNVIEYGDPTMPDCKQLKLSSKMSQQELVQMIPAKLTGAQIGILYSALKNIEQISFDTVIASLNAEESNAKWGLINILEHLRTYNIFSPDPTPYDEIVSPGTCSIINLRGIPAEIQGIIVYKLTKDLFEERKKGTLPPFFLVLEEGHNFCPERSFGETTASKTIRTIASEGRKFGLGLCVISQRPARLDKSVISQCTTQIILKVTNPNDLKAVSSSVEGLTAEAEKEIANLPIGTALVTGVVDVPLLVNVRPRRTLHGGHSVDIFTEIAERAKRPKTPSAPRAAGTQPSTTTAPTIPPTPTNAFAQQPQKAIQREAIQREIPAQKETVQEQRAAQTEKPITKARKEEKTAEAPKVEPPPQIGPAIALIRPKKTLMEQLMRDKPLSSVQQFLAPCFLVNCTQGNDSFRLLVDRQDGGVVTNINMFSTKKLPDMKSLSKEELKVLQSAYAKKIPPGDIAGNGTEAQSLIAKGYLVKQADGIGLSEKYLFMKLSKVRSDEELEFTRVTDAITQPARVTEKETRDMLTPFVTIKNVVECYVLRILIQ